MHTTSISLLEDLRQPPAADAWERFVRLYTPLLAYWARRVGLRDQDASDLVQDVLLALVRKMPEFRHQPGRPFRAWLRTVLMNKWRDRPRRGAPVALDGANEPLAPPDADPLEEREYRLYVLGQALRLMADDFAPVTWQACWDTVVLGRPATDVARERGVTVNAVYLAKARVLRRLRCDLAWLLE